MNEQRTIDPSNALRNLRSISERINMLRVAGKDPIECEAGLNGNDLYWIDEAVAFLGNYQTCTCGAPDNWHTHDKHGIHCPKVSK